MIETELFKLLNCTKRVYNYIHSIKLNSHISMFIFNLSKFQLKKNFETEMLNIELTS